MSTREVEGVLSSVDFLQEVNVYGVAVPGEEGVPPFPPPTAALGRDAPAAGPGGKGRLWRCEVGEPRVTGVPHRV